MKYKSGAALRQALEQRLLDRARETGTSLFRLRKTVVFDRLLARLAVAAPNRWVLKGRPGSRLQAWARITRTTKDMDLICNDNETAATADLIAAQAVELEDLFSFEVQKIGTPVNKTFHTSKRSISEPTSGPVAPRKPRPGANLHES